MPISSSAARPATSHAGSGDPRVRWVCWPLDSSPPTQRTRPPLRTNAAIPATAPCAQTREPGLQTLVDAPCTPHSPPPTEKKSPPAAPKSPRARFSNPCQRAHPQPPNRGDGPGATPPSLPRPPPPPFPHLARTSPRAPRPPCSQHHTPTPAEHNKSIMGDEQLIAVPSTDYLREYDPMSRRDLHERHDGVMS